MKWSMKKIDFAEVQADKKNWTTTQFNTSCHTQAEAPDKSPATEEPYSYSKWLPVILRSRGLPAFACQRITLTSLQVNVLIEACNASIQIGRINLSVAEDLNDQIAPAFSQLVFPPEGLFVRLNVCSPKDGAQKVPGKVSLHTIEEIILRLVTSCRCRSALERCVAAGTPVELFFMPFDRRLSPDKEYHVFSRPEDLRITGISQYRWHEPWRYVNQSEDQQREIMQTICSAADDFVSQIYYHTETNADLAFQFLKQGVSFDLFYDELSKEVEMVELNPFGIRSPSGSCLFHWVKDRRILYDEDRKKGIEFWVSF
ncbi:hypothetical protein CMUS01_13620 [Colletotrichum musicola]|uniref:Cell division cycle protein 123 n=1 Tax=Colletotrichum musicola TaxID=2175873 RepID=A0A8H6JBV4_9PEZI|nr:hypothetical protein CMUS01_13620 [Colletotrichum musicola]